MIVVPNRVAKNDINLATVWTGMTARTAGEIDASGAQIRDHSNAHHLERIDLLIDPHRADLGGGAAADGRGQCHARGRRRDEADVEEGSQKPVRASIPTFDKVL